MNSFLEHFPIATVVHLLGALALCIVFVAKDGELPDDSIEFFGILLGGNGLVAIGRGVASDKRAR